MQYTKIKTEVITLPSIACFLAKIYHRSCLAVQSQTVSGIWNDSNSLRDCYPLNHTSTITEVTDKSGSEFLKAALKHTV